MVMVPERPALNDSQFWHAAAAVAAAADAAAGSAAAAAPAATAVRRSSESWTQTTIWRTWERCPSGRSDTFFVALFRYRLVRPQPAGSTTIEISRIPF